MKNPVGDSLFRDVCYSQNTGDIAGVGLFHQIDLTLHIPSRFLAGDLDKAGTDLLCVLAAVGRQKRLVEIDVQKLLTLFLIGYEASQRGKEPLPVRAE